MSPPHKRSSKYIKNYVLLIALLFVFGVGFFVGQGKTPFKSEATTLAPTSLQDFYITNSLREQQEKIAKDKHLDFAMFWQVWDEIKLRHVKKDITDEQLFYGALSGLVGSLEDPYSVFFDPKTAKQFTEDLEGAFGGIGAEIGVRNKIITIIAPIPESPAERAGVKSGDYVLEIDGKDTSGFSLEEAVSKIRGEKGTSVKLTLGRENEPVKELTIVRDIIKVPNATLKVEAGIAYIGFHAFTETSVEDFRNTVDKALAEKPQGIILDLRNNPGGFLDASIDIAGEWVKYGDLVVIERTSDGKEKKHYAAGRGVLAQMPTVILVNQGSASASEILAGALKDHGLAQLVGMKTFGKGSVQDLSFLPDGSGLKLTIAEWLTPNKNAINEKGIDPDFEVEIKEPKKGETLKDNQLEKAKEVLKTLIK